MATPPHSFYNFKSPAEDSNSSWFNPLHIRNTLTVRKFNMPIIAVKSIIVLPGRQRQDFDPVTLQELSVTIGDKGLFHAPVLREITDEDIALHPTLELESRREEGKVLVAGERRIRAISDMRMLGGTLRYNDEIIPDGFLPFVNLGELSQLDAEEAELEENIRRKDLTWQEQAAITGKLHAIRTGQARAEGRIHTVADTSVESRGRCDGAYQETVRQEIIVQKHLGNPLIANAKNVNDAFKILKKQEETKKYEASAALVGKTFSCELHEAHNVNCLSWMRTCEPAQFDVICTDPPYGMNANTFGDGSGGRMSNNEHHYDDSPESWRLLMAQWCPLSFRVAKPLAHAYVCCDIARFPELTTMMQEAGWYVFRTPFISVKPNSGRVPLPDEGPRRQYETILYAIKGHKHTTAIYPDVITTFADSGFNHGAQKSVALFENLLRRSVRPGDTVLDSFSGTGTIFPAANNLQCKAVGLEMAAEYYAMGLSRLELLSQPSGAVDSPDLGDELKQLMGRS
jgi:DNA modification methylase